MPVEKLTDRRPEIGADELVTTLVPPPRFDGVRFSTYVPNADEPSQAAAVEACSAFADRVAASGQQKSGWRSLFGRKPEVEGKPGLYLDGGFGVGKTHLLASIWHAVPGPKSYGTFVELTHVVGALGFAEAVRRLSEHRLLAIDEFELDDPGDTMLVNRLLRELTAAGVFVAATSNTLPDKLGEGRFAAEDFLREIQALSAKFGVVRVDGPDYRHRGLPDPPAPVTDEELLASAEARPGSTIDDFDALCEHLATLHPSGYGRLVDGVAAVHLRGVRPAGDQSLALRLVALADRLYDRAIPVLVSGESLSGLFTEEMLAGGYRKKYLRAVSRLTALARDAAASPVPR
ncbi:cell division protein ZapE [Prauserella cavernicola]|uniref:Cell division protein ZapE n=1 Tax=Prauserella cavernicola TaxID=2800127 RepID=A0A934V8K5_9PSEU|nr:cell division protein ZapE [Prauserella cavernicola]MBK1788784.1 cell division protein ZapE [Prauserella cavernicola]